MGCNLIFKHPSNGGRCTPPVTSRSGGLLISVSADVRCWSDDVIASKVRDWDRINTSEPETVSRV